MTSIPQELPCSLQYVAPVTPLLSLFEAIQPAFFLAVSFNFDEDSFNTIVRAVESHSISQLDSEELTMIAVAVAKNERGLDSLRKIVSEIALYRNLDDFSSKELLTISWALKMYIGDNSFSLQVEEEIHSRAEQDDRLCAFRKNGDEIISQDFPDEEKLKLLSVCIQRLHPRMFKKVKTSALELEDPLYMTEKTIRDIKSND